MPRIALTINAGTKAISRTSSFDLMNDKLDTDVANSIDSSDAVRGMALPLPLPLPLPLLPLLLLSLSLSLPLSLPLLLLLSLSLPLMLLLLPLLDSMRRLAFKQFGFLDFFVDLLFSGSEADAASC